MHMYINTETHEYPVFPAQIMERNPQTSFPLPFAPVAPYVAVLAVEHPAYDPDTQRVVETEPLDADGVYSQQWEIVDFTQAEIDAARKALVPPVVTRRQARQALLLAGLLDDVQPAIDAIPDPLQRGLAQIEWDDSQEFTRDRPLLIQLAQGLGLNDEALDNLFIQAGLL